MQYMALCSLLNTLDTATSSAHTHPFLQGRQDGTQKMKSLFVLQATLASALAGHHFGTLVNNGGTVEDPASEYVITTTTLITLPPR
jgi:hypothetical protein